eukprot:TRINITY_DN1905_c0_g1_i1.p1 TRINITY_DN1905_c0_g1~~TRINITY_DN1905_c0_g1_i1.p1  ORF type:complete len:128 (-),score=43.44 TRINITY_DN1905_c0_g1_i1:297-680(-)
MASSAPSTPQIDTLKSKDNTNSPLRSQTTILPMARVKTIMKSSPEVENIGQESLFLITKATEVFIMYLTKLSQRYGNDQELTYSDLATIVSKKDSMEFLQDIVPKKIKYSEYLAIMEKENQVEDSFY